MYYVYRKGYYYQLQKSELIFFDYELSSLFLLGLIFNPVAELTVRVTFITLLEVGDEISLELCCNNLKISLVANKLNNEEFKNSTTPIIIFIISSDNLLQILN